MSKPVYVYLMERISGRSRYAKRNRLREIKIGISNNPVRRVQEVDEHIKGRVIIDKIYPFENREKALDIEQKFHRRFRMKRIFRSGVPGSGYSEFFYLSGSDISKLKKSLSDLSYEPRLNFKMKLQHNSIMILIYSFSLAMTFFLLYLVS